MTQILCRPLDAAAPGSWRAFDRVRQLKADFQTAVASGEETAVMASYDAWIAFLRPRLSTDDGSNLEAALDQLSLDQMLNFIRTFGLERVAVPLESSGRSPNGSRVKAKARRG